MIAPSLFVGKMFIFAKHCYLNEWKIVFSVHYILKENCLHILWVAAEIILTSLECQQEINHSLLGSPRGQNQNSMKQNHRIQGRIKQRELSKFMESSSYALKFLLLMMPIKLRIAMREILYQKLWAIVTYSNL